MKPLDGIRVLDLTRMVVGATAGMLLADFGAEVIKIEQPREGDPLRRWTTKGQPYWWKVYGRGKRYVTLDLKSPEGAALLWRLIPRFDVLMESFVPGRLEGFGFSWDRLHAAHPGLVLLRISAWGQSGPGSQRPGFGTLVEAASGFAAMNGEPGGAPIVPAFPLADTVTGLYAVNAAMFALYHRDVHRGQGQVIDLSLFESLFSLMGPLAAEYTGAGRVREREGSRSKNSSPRGCYRTADGRWIAVSGSTPTMAERFLRAYGLGALLEEPWFATNEARVSHAAELDTFIERAIAARTLAENVDIIATNDLTAVPVQTIADILADPHWQARGLTVDVPDGASSVRMHDTVPRLSETPGSVGEPGDGLGADNDAFYQEELGLDGGELARLRQAGVI